MKQFNAPASKRLLSTMRSSEPGDSEPFVEVAHPYRASCVLGEALPDIARERDDVNLLEALASRLLSEDAVHRRNPQALSTVLINCRGRHVAQTVFFADPLPALPVATEEPVNGADPDRALVVLEQRERQAPLSETVPLTVQSQLAVLIRPSGIRPLTPIHNDRSRALTSAVTAPTGRRVSPRALHVSNRTPSNRTRPASVASQRYPSASCAMPRIRPRAGLRSLSTLSPCSRPTVRQQNVQSRRRASRQEGRPREPDGKPQSGESPISPSCWLAVDSRMLDERRDFERGRTFKSNRPG